MLTSYPGSISSARLPNSYYVEPKRGSVSRNADEPSYDCAVFSSEASESGFQRSLVSRLSQEVRTANTTGSIQSLRAAVLSGEYVPDCMAIAGRMLFLAEEA